MPSCTSGVTVSGRCMPVSMVQVYKGAPGQAQVSHVGGVDLIERAVPPVAVGPPPHEPVVGWRGDQHVLGYRGVTISDRDCADMERPVPVRE